MRKQAHWQQILLQSTQYLRKLGVTATANGAAIVLSNTDGSDIVTTGYAAADNDTYQAGVVLAGDVTEDNSDFTVTGGPTVESGNAVGAGQANNTITSTDVLTQSTATLHC